MSIVHFVEFKQTGKAKDFTGGRFEGRRKFYVPFFDATNRRNEQPTTVKTIFSSR